VHYRNGSDASLPVSTSVAVHLYRIAQEAVRNAIEHGAATEVQIDLSSEDGYVMLRIRDDGGRGFDSTRESNGMASASCSTSTSRKWLVRRCVTARTGDHCDVSRASGHNLTRRCMNKRLKHSAHKRRLIVDDHPSVFTNRI
jgi:signal transduction histidine kinase